MPDTLSLALGNALGILNQLLKGFNLKKIKKSTEDGTWGTTGAVFPRLSVHVMRLILPALLLLPTAGSAPAEVSQERVREVAKGLACLCGTCPRRPLDECECGWADQKRARIAEALEAGQDREAIIAGFVAEFGQEAYVTPPASGFNLSAWIMPIMVLLLGAVMLGVVLRNWSRRHIDPAAGRVTETEADDPYRLRLERELRERDQ